MPLGARREENKEMLDVLEKEQEAMHNTMERDSCKNIDGLVNMVLSNVNITSK